MPINTEIVVNLRVEGLHKWEQCPYEDVAYLRDLHRHVFHIRACHVVNHGDREIEIIRFKRVLHEHFLRYWDPTYHCANFGNRSCEHIATELVTTYGLSSCEVLEDGENGATVWTTQA